MSNEQCFVSPDGRDAFLVIGSVLYRMHAGDERPYELLLDGERSNLAGDTFVFEDSKRHEQGVLSCKQDAAAVETNLVGTQIYAKTPLPSNYGIPERLSEFDFRQKPALLLKVRGLDLLLYLSQAVYDTEPYELKRAFLITLRADGRPEEVHDYGALRDKTTRRPDAARAYQVAMSTHRLYLKPQSTLATGTWHELGSDVVLERIPLEGYRIHHRPDGSLYFFGPLD